MINITKDTIIGDILDIAPQTAPIFLSIGMHCLGCPSSRGETVEEACMVHGVDCEPFLAQLNQFLEAYEANKVGQNLPLIQISEPTRQAEISYAAFCLKKKKHQQATNNRRLYTVRHLQKASIAKPEIT